MLIIKKHNIRQKMSLLQLNSVVIEKIFQYLSYEEISRNRLICTPINEICQNLLNKGFNKMVDRHSSYYSKTMYKLYEGGSQYKPLERHLDVMESVESRISMLSKTYSKYIRLGWCCFIPGKVIDEIHNILNLLQNTSVLLDPNYNDLLMDKLRFLSGMAIAHFQHDIVTVFKKKYFHSHKNIFTSIKKCHCLSSVFLTRYKFDLASSTEKYDMLKRRYQLTCQSMHENDKLDVNRLPFRKRPRFHQMVESHSIDITKQSTPTNQIECRSMDEKVNEASDEIE